MKVVIVTGLSGGGKTTALRALEDLGFFCCDNLPLPLFAAFVENLESQNISECAISVDARQESSIPEYHRQFSELRQAGHQVEILFLEAADAVLFRRFSETRRRHPSSGDDIKEGIARDREVLATLRQDATLVNTGGLNVHEIKEIISNRFRAEKTTLSVKLQSFGFKYGLPTESEVVFDVRYLPNPHFDEILGPQDGRDRDVAAYVFSEPEAEQTVERIEEYLRFSLPLFAREGKLYLTVGVGCTGGRHRSVAITEELTSRLSGDWHILLRHRDLSKSTARMQG